MHWVRREQLTSPRPRDTCYCARPNSKPSRSGVKKRDLPARVFSASCPLALFPLPRTRPASSRPQLSRPLHCSTSTTLERPDSSSQTTRPAMLNDYSTFRDKPTPFSSTSALASTAALVPQELWDLILDRLDSYADLSTAARVCRAWNARAVQRLYHTLVFRAPTNIDDDHPQPTPTHLDGLVRAKSAVLPYIRHVLYCSVL